MNEFDFKFDVIYTLKYGKKERWLTELRIFENGLYFY